MKKILIYLLTSLLSGFALAQNFWTQKTDFGGVARYRAQGVSIGNKGYFLGGASGSATSHKDFWEYDPATNVWTQKTDFPGTARGGGSMTSFELNGKGYFGMGAYWTGAPSAYTCYNDFYMYDPATNSWTQKAGFPGTGRHSQVSFTIEDKGYVGTGISEAENLLNDFWEYNPVIDSWTQKYSIGTSGRANGAGFAIGKKGYIGMGRNFGGSLSDFWEYDRTSNTWTQKSDFGGGTRSYLIGISISGYGFAGLGSNGSSNFNDWWRYDPGINAWVQKSSFTGTARGNAASFVVGGKGYVGTGYSTTWTKDFYEYTPDNYGTEDFSPLNAEIYFQPNSSILFVKANDISGIKVFDMSGRLIYAESYNNIDQTNVDLASCRTGAYIIQVMTDNHTVSKKIIKGY